MDTLPCLWQQNKVADTGRYGTEKLPSLLPECAKRHFMQNGVESLIEAKDLQVTVVNGIKTEMSN